MSAFHPLPTFLPSQNRWMPDQVRHDECSQAPRLSPPPARGTRTFSRKSTCPYSISYSSYFVAFDFRGAALHLLRLSDNESHAESRPLRLSRNPAPRHQAWQPSPADILQ